MNVVKMEARLSRLLYRLGIPLAMGAAVVLGFEVFGVRGRWLVLPAVITGFVLTTGFSLWLTGRPHFFTSPFKR